MLVISSSASLTGSDPSSLNEDCGIRSGVSEVRGKEHGSYQKFEKDGSNKSIESHWKKVELENKKMKIEI